MQEEIENVRRIGHTSLSSSSSDMDSADMIPLTSESTLMRSFGERRDKRTHRKRRS